MSSQSSGIHTVVVLVTPHDTKHPHDSANVPAQTMHYAGTPYKNLQLETEMISAAVISTDCSGGIDTGVSFEGWLIQDNSFCEMQDRIIAWLRAISSRYQLRSRDPRQWCSLIHTTSS